MNFVGQKYNRLLILEKLPKKDKNQYYKCKCDCGNIKIINQSALRSGKTKSCGCLIRLFCESQNIKYNSVRGSIDKNINKYKGWKLKKIKNNEKR